MRRWKGLSAELCDDSRPRTSPVQRQVAGGLLKRSAVPLFTRIATSVLTGAPTAPEWVHPLRARQPAPRARNGATMFQSAAGRHPPSLSSAPLLLPSNYPCQSGFHIQSIIWCPLVLPRSSVRKPTTSITHNTGR